MEDPATTSALPLASLSDKHHKELLFLSLVHGTYNLSTLIFLHTIHFKNAKFPNIPSNKCDFLIKGSLIVVNYGEFFGIFRSTKRRAW